MSERLEMLCGVRFFSNEVDSGDWARKTIRFLIGPEAS